LIALTRTKIGIETRDPYVDECSHVFADVAEQAKLSHDEMCQVGQALHILFGNRVSYNIH
jgi:hypothetical protein